MGEGSAGEAVNRPLAVLLSEAFDTLVAALHRRLPEAGFDDIRPAHCTGVFRVIDPEGTRPGELARRAGMTPQGMAELVRYLEQRGYVERSPSAGDGRGRVVTLTPKGRKAAAAAGEAFAAIEARWTDQLGARRMAELRRTLSDLGHPDA